MAQLLGSFVNRFKDNTDLRNCFPKIGNVPSTLEQLSRERREMSAALLAWGKQQDDLFPTEKPIHALLAAMAECDDAMNEATVKFCAVYRGSFVSRWKKILEAHSRLSDAQREVEAAKKNRQNPSAISLAAQELQNAGLAATRITHFQIRTAYFDLYNAWMSLQQAGARVGLKAMEVIYGFPALGFTEVGAAALKPFPELPGPPEARRPPWLAALDAPVVPAPAPTPHPAVDDKAEQIARLNLELRNAQDSLRNCQQQLSAAQSDAAKAAAEASKKPSPTAVVSFALGVFDNISAASASRVAAALQATARSAQEALVTLDTDRAEVFSQHLLATLAALGTALQAPGAPADLQSLHRDFTDAARDCLRRLQAGVPVAKFSTAFPLLGKALEDLVHCAGQQQRPLSRDTAVGAESLKAKLSADLSALLTAIDEQSTIARRKEEPARSQLQKQLQQLEQIAENTSVLMDAATMFQGRMALDDPNLRQWLTRWTDTLRTYGIGVPRMTAALQASSDTIALGPVAQEMSTALRPLSEVPNISQDPKLVSALDALQNSLALA